METRSDPRPPDGLTPDPLTPTPRSSIDGGRRPLRTPWSEGGAALWTGSWNHAEDTEPHQRVSAKRPGRVRDSESAT